MNGRTPVLKKRAALPKCQVRRAEFNALYYVFIIDAIELQATPPPVCLHFFRITTLSLIYLVRKIGFWFGLLCHSKIGNKVKESCAST